MKRLGVLMLSLVCSAGCSDAPVEPTKLAPVAKLCLVHLDATTGAVYDRCLRADSTEQ
jgi:hypothetical protein